MSTPADGTMYTLHEFIHGLETFLNNEPLLKKRNDHIKSTIGDNRALSASKF
jgi:hypothetical protein